MIPDKSACPLCHRVNAIMSEHHLVPKSLGGTETVLICSDCHNAIHTHYSNKELADSFHSLELILQDNDLRRAFRFLGKQDPRRRFRNKRSNRRPKGKYK